MTERHRHTGRLRQRLLWVALLTLLTACSEGQALPASSTTDAPSDTRPAASTAAPAEFDPFVLTVNVDITESGYEPTDVFVPAGRSIQLVVRNRTSSEHHYKVVGMATENLLWLSRPETEIEEGVSEQDHMFHHIAGYVNWRGASPTGIRPTLEEVHAYSAGGANDVVRFTPLSVGTFSVEDPLHPELTGTMTVFE